MSNKQAVLLFSYSDKLSTIMLWWKAFFMLPIWGYLAMPFAGSIIAFAGTTALQASFMGIVIWSLAYFLEDILKRKIRIEDNLITHGFRTRELSKLLSIGTEYKSNDVLPKKMILTFAQGKNMSFNLSRVNAPEYQRLLKQHRKPLPTVPGRSCSKHRLLNCKKIARKVLVDDGDKFIIEYRSGQTWRNMRQAPLWTQPHPPLAALRSAFCCFSPWLPGWLSYIYTWLYMPVYSKLHTSENIQTMLTNLFSELTKPAIDITADAAGRKYL